MTSESRDLSAVLRRTLSWWLPLGIVMMAVTILANPGFSAWRSGWGLVDLALSRLGFTLPFLAFVTGVAAVGPTSATVGRLRAATMIRVVLAGGLLAIVGYTISSVAEPLAEHRLKEVQGTVVAEQLLFGPNTPVSLLRQLRASESTPPDDYTFSTARPNDRPPNWLTHLIHGPIAWAVFSIPNALLGYLVALLTVDLRPIRRRQVRWAAGLGVSVSFLLAAVSASTWVRASPSNSGVWASWLPVVWPCLLVLIVRELVVRFGDDPPDPQRNG